MSSFADSSFEQYDPSMPQAGLSRSTKRTPMACSFCRGRKLKCDGKRPSCTNCDKRILACVYQPVNPPPEATDKSRSQ
ncbi:hypothetical protein CPB83DRAFT_853265 [Crepidotus variabilis]|uniref:Zn(2)-C6 fungal-type domain-containing protein n=1 Tax=Crepidotus variabilis TaxID=179855 RepID=A0A9P6EGG6_9AGAR|nr:hypothetical protein CPB83DRAFT_853265 [Crepidotus variabilis]